MASEPVAGNDSKTVKVTVVVLYNGTYVLDPYDDPGLQIAEIVLLVLVLLLAFALNMLLLVTIVSSYTLRKVPFNMLLANLSAVFLVECLVNMVVALYYVTVDVWKLGHVGCSLSSFTVQLVTLEVTFVLCMMCAEGMVSLWQPLKFQTFLTAKKQIVAIVTLWVAGILLCLPLSMESITSRMFPARYSCSLAGKDTFAYGMFLTIWCYSLIILISFSCLLILGIRRCKEYKTHRKKHDINYTDIFMQGDLWTDWINVKVAGILFLFYLLLELPYIVIHQISSLKTYEDNPEYFNSTIGVFIEPTQKYETVFTWFRYAYSCLFAVFVFKLRKDIRRKLQSFLNCCHRNVVRDHSPIPVMRQENKKKNNKAAKKVSIHPLSLNTPVLYISPDGLCLRQLDPNSKQQNFTKAGYTEEPNFISYLCDVECSTSIGDWENDTDIFLSSIDSSARRSSKESEVSLPEFDISRSDKSQELPLKDIDLKEIAESPKTVTPPPKKSVRFAETLTVYHPLTPNDPTPTQEWGEQRYARKYASKIPTRIRRVEHATPWKVAADSTYHIKTPVMERKIIKKIVDDSKAPNSKGYGNTGQLQNRTRHSSFPTSRFEWRVNRQ